MRPSFLHRFGSGGSRRSLLHLQLPLIQNNLNPRIKIPSSRLGRPQHVSQSQAIFNHHLFSSASSSNPPPITSRLVNLTKLSTLIVTLVALYAYLSDTRAGLHSWLALPLIKSITNDDPEKAHHLAIKILKLLSKYHLIVDKPQPDDEKLSFKLWGRKFDNPIGMAAGFDKNGDAIDGLFDIGFGYVEIGSVTPQPQPGNPLPRLFRIPSTESIVNRYGFNSQGHLAVLSKLRQRLINYIHQHRYLFDPNNTLPLYEPFNPIQTIHANSHLDQFTPTASIPSSFDQTLFQLSDQIDIPRSLRNGRVFAVNLGKNKLSPVDSVDDFKFGVERFGPLADVLVINISSPNTPGLRNLQSKSLLTKVLNDVVESRNNLKNNLENVTLPAVLVKVAPDLTAQELIEVAQVAQDAKVDGIIISNTTTSRPAGSGTEADINQSGGLSGPPLKPLSLRALSIIYSATSGKLPLIGCGGISSAEDVLEYGKAGASFVQLYTALTYQGLGLPRKLKDELKVLLDQKENGKNWSQIIGTAASQYPLEELTSLEKEPSNQLEEDLRLVKEELAEVEGRVKKITAEITEDDQKVTELVCEWKPKQTPPSPQASALVDQSNTNFVGNEKTRAPGKILDAINKDQPQRGILLIWKERREREMRNGDFKRTV
ncbi:hypothetical protein O181_034571 [Austropuccinia psidii MF-1]|uniref:Dihydroorotate dehydrogenase (quinone), mitochondrial n=1 Tax=Austropuccinia psidii MF-1 TaxID=1389203 RepID=A0A9Q3D6M2_9BASI|nr:hypothetical protein [Austropuccinia psidii MF-1]